MPYGSYPAGKHPKGGPSVTGKKPAKTSAKKMGNDGKLDARAGGKTNSRKIIDKRS